MQAKASSTGSIQWHLCSTRVHCVGLEWKGIKINIAVQREGFFSSAGIWRVSFLPLYLSWGLPPQQVTQLAVYLWNKRAAPLGRFYRCWLAGWLARWLCVLVVYLFTTTHRCSGVAPGYRSHLNKLQIFSSPALVLLVPSLTHGAQVPSSSVLDTQELWTLYLQLFWASL